MGSPNGQMYLGDRHLLFYERGAVELVNGRVVRVDLRSPEQQASLEAREERLREEREALRAQLVVEGTALRDRKLGDAAFQAAPAAYQVAFWEDFARRYPGVPCVEPLAIARLKLNEQLDEKRRRDDERQRLVQIEERLAAAEQEPAYYRVRHYHHYGRHDRHQEFALWPVSYRYYDGPLPVYTTPTTPLVNPFPRDPAQPERRDYNHPREDRWNRHDRGNRDGRHGWRDAERNRGPRHDRM